MRLQLTSVQEAALNACGEALVDIGVPIVSLGFDSRFENPFMVTGRARPQGDFVAASGATLAEAFAGYLARERGEAGKPEVIKTATQLKSAVLAIVDEARGAGPGDGSDSAKLDEIANKVAELRVG